MDGDGIPEVSSEDFVFRTGARRARSRRPPEFSFARPVPVKRSLSGDDGEGEYGEELDTSAVFHFSKNRSKRRAIGRHTRPAISGSGATGHAALPAVAPAATPTSGTDASSNAAPPIDAPFDMSKFSKPGEWKCDACFVRNGPEQDKCASCETPRSGGVNKAGMGANGGGVGQGGTAQIAASRGGLFSGISTSSTPFTFGVQPAGGSSKSDDTTAAASSGGTAPLAEAPFDMSKFSKPGEWKCSTCLVRNGPGLSKCASCETPRPGAAGGASGAGGGSVGSGATSLEPPVAVRGGDLTGISVSSIPFAFDVQRAEDSTENGGSTAAVSAGGSAPLANAPFDMSKFIKPGEWKCSACFVRNSSKAAKCASCETPRQGAGGGAGISGGLSHAAPSTAAQGGLLPKSATARTPFTFGVRPGGDDIGSGASAHVAARPGGFQFGAAFSSAPTSAIFQLGAARSSVQAGATPSTASAGNTGGGGFVFGAAPSPAATSPAASSSAFGGFSAASPAPSTLTSSLGRPASSAATAVGSASYPSTGAGFVFGTTAVSGSLNASGGAAQATAGSSTAAPVLTFGAGSRPAPTDSSRTPASIFNFGAGSLPAPANPNAPTSSFAFGGSTSAPASVGGSSGPAFTLGSGGGWQKK